MPPLIQLHWLPVRQRIIYKLRLLVHKALTGQVPSYLRELINPVAGIPSRASLRSAETADIYNPRTRLRFGYRAFSVAGAKHWNSLPAELRLIADTSTFKKHLKT